MFVLLSSMTYHRVCNNLERNMTGATTGTGTVYPSGAPEFTTVHLVQSFSFCVVLCRSVFVIFLLTNALSVLIVVGFITTYVSK